MIKELSLFQVNGPTTDYKPAPITKADIKALAAYLNVMADEPPRANTRVTLGAFDLHVTIEAVT